MSYQPEPKPPFYDPQARAAEQYRQDGDQLQLLSILYYVLAGFATLGACLPLLYFGVGMVLVGGAAIQADAEAQAGLAVFGGLVMLIAVPFALLLIVQVVCLFLTGRYLSQSRNHIFCFINACILCMHAPFGTALGIFTIIVLSRESVKQRFEMNRSSYLSPSYRQY